LEGKTADGTSGLDGKTFCADRKKRRAVGKVVLTAARYNELIGKHRTPQVNVVGGKWLAA